MPNRFVKSKIIPGLRRISWIPFVQKGILKHKLRAVEYNKKLIDEIIQNSEKIYLHLKSKPFVGIMYYGDNIIINPINDNKLRYINFLEYNNIEYELYNVCKSDWFQNVTKYDVIIWDISSQPSRLEEAKNKIFIIETILGKKCYPSFENIYSYENKVLQYYLYNIYNLPYVPTFVSNDLAESLNFIEHCSFPIVSKISTGSGSRGVTLIRNKRYAKRLINAVFSSGKNTYYSYLKQKDYVYFQEYIPDAEYDLRVIVIGNKLFGYYRMRPRKDFRASGANIIEKKELPEEAMRTAISCRDHLNATMIAVDMIYSNKYNKFMIIESSIFFGIETAEQLKVNDVPGYYLYEDNKFIFEEGKYWVQDLAIEIFLKEWDNSRI